jgi:DNA repair photolyase
MPVVLTKMTNSKGQKMGGKREQGNIFSYVTHTWNPCRGACPHCCRYCFQNRERKQNFALLDESEFSTDLGVGRFIFVGSSCDLFAEEIDMRWILRTLAHCRRYKYNRYLFQTKNPKRLYGLQTQLPENSVCGTTIETNRYYLEMGKAPLPRERIEYLKLFTPNHETMISFEPIMDFDLNKLTAWAHRVKPSWINIGANTNPKVELTEPSSEKLCRLAEQLNLKFNVKCKDSLKRLWPNGSEQRNASFSFTC